MDTPNHVNLIRIDRSLSATGQLSSDLGDRPLRPAGVYCMSENMKFPPRESLLTLEERSSRSAGICDLGAQ